MKITQGRSGKVILFLFVVLSFMLLNSIKTAGGAQNEKEEIGAIISSMSYGYKVKVLINGNDIGMKGGMSESKRLFEKDSPMSKQAPFEMRKKLFVLQKGQNTISVEYKKDGKNEHDHAEITLEAEGYPAPIFKMDTKKPSGKVEKTFDLQIRAPKDFKPVTAD